MNADRVRPATKADFCAIYGRVPVWRVQAVAASDNAGRLLGIGGIERQPIGPCLFMDVAAGVDVGRHRRTLIRAARATLDLARRSGGLAFAMRDARQPASETFLEHFGFVRVSTTGQQEIWLWEQR